MIDELVVDSTQSKADYNDVEPDSNGIVSITNCLIVTTGLFYSHHLYMVADLLPLLCTITIYVTFWVFIFLSLIYRIHS